MVALASQPDQLDELSRLVRDHLERFVSAVLKLAGWSPGRNAILDGLRHAEVHVELRRQLGDGADLHVVHVDLSDEVRATRAKASEGLDAVAFARYAQDLTEAQLERVLPAYADLVLDGADSIDRLADLVLRRFGFPGRAQNDRGEHASLSKRSVFPTLRFGYGVGEGCWLVPGLLVRA